MGGSGKMIVWLCEYLSTYLLLACVTTMMIGAASLLTVGAGGTIWLRAMKGRRRSGVCGGRLWKR